MKISKLFEAKKPVISFEVFPPKKTADAQSLYASVDQMQQLAPGFVSVTYSAGGSGHSEETIKIANRLKHVHGIEPLVHLTCINSKREKVHAVLDELKANGLDNILALRGDLMDDTDLGQVEYSYAKDLIAHIRSLSPDFCVAAAAYPEGHVDCDNFDLSVDYLKEKVDLGAAFLITQLFFDNELFYRFAERARKKGIQVPISAGIMPVLSKGQIDRMIYMCGASLPAKVVRMLNRYPQEDDLLQAGIEYASQQIADMIAQGVEGVHIYTMNKPHVARAIVEHINR